MYMFIHVYVYICVDLRLSLLMCVVCLVLWWAGEWKEHKTPQGSTYGERAQTMIDAMWSTQMIQDGK